MEEYLYSAFSHELEKYGYPTDNIEYSFGYCQGDGVAFYGSLSNDEMNLIINRMYKKGHLSNEYFDLYKLIYNEDFRVLGEIKKNYYGYHYSHYNTMDFWIDGDIHSKSLADALFPDMLEKHLFISLADHIEELFAKIEKYIENEIKVISIKLQKEGYKIMKNTVF